MTKPTKRLALLTVAAAGGLALTACGGAAPPVVPVELSSDDGATVTTEALPGSADPGETAPASPFADPGRPVSIDGEYDVAIGEAGTARFAVAGRQVTLLDLQLNAGWQQVREEREFDEVELTLVNGGTEVRLDAGTDDGRFETDVDIDSPALPARVTYAASDAGTVDVDVDGRFVGLVGHEAAAGWVATIDERDLAQGEVEIQFRNDAESRSVTFDADIDDGELNVDIDSRFGANHFERGPGR